MIRSRSRSLRLTTAVLLTPLLTVTACSGDKGSDKAETPGTVLAAAKKQLDGTSGVKLALETAKLPDGVDGVMKASGVGTHDPAFDGNITVLVSSLTVDVPVVAVGGKVYAKLPFTKSFSEIDPGDYGAPDPAALMQTSGGVSSWLTDAENVKSGEQRRDGSEVLTSYTGKLPGSSVVSVIPSADAKAHFDATFEVDQKGRLHSAEVTGPFYGNHADVDYTITLTDYGTDKTITKP